MTDALKPTAADLSNLVREAREAIAEQRDLLVQRGQLTSSTAEDLDRQEAEVEVLNEIGRRILTGTVDADDRAPFREQIAQIAALEGVRRLLRPTMLN